MAMQSGFIKRIRDIMRMDAGINGDAQRIEQMVWMLFLKVYDAKEDDWEINEDDYVSIIPEDCRWRNWAQADENGHAMTGDKLLDFVNNTLFPTLKELSVTPETPVKKAIVKSTFEDANNYMKDGVYLRQVIEVIDEIEFDDVKESHAFGFVYEEILKDLQAAGSSGEFYTPRAVTDFMALMIQPKLGERMADFACGTGGFITSWLGQLSKQVTDTDAQRQFDDSIYGIEKKPFPYLLCVTNMLLHDIEIPNIYHDNSLKHNLLDYTEDDKFNVILMNPPYGGHEDKSIQSFYPDDLASSETADLFMSVIMHRLKKDGRAAVILPDAFLYGADNAKTSIKKKLVTNYNLHTVIRMPGTIFAPYTSITTNILFFDNSGPTTDTWFYRMDMPEGYLHFSKTKPVKLEHFNEIIEWWNNRSIIKDENGTTFKAKNYSTQEIADNNYNLDYCGYLENDEEILSPEETLENFRNSTALMLDTLNTKLNTLESICEGYSIEKTQFPIFSTINEELGNAILSFSASYRKSVLQAAMSGELSEQIEGNTSDDILAKCSEIKAALIKSKKIKPEKADDEDLPVPFEIPSNWKWAKLSDLVYVYSGLAYNKGNLSVQTDKMITVFRGGNIQDFNYVFKADDVKISSDFIKKNELYLKKNQLITPAVTSLEHLGKVARIDKDYDDVVAGGFVLNLVPYIDDDILSTFIMYAFGMPTMRTRCKEIANKSGQAFYNMSRTKLLNSWIPLPPRDEQEIIVNKLNDLITLC